MRRPILIWPDPLLKKPAKPVEKVDASVRTLLQDMFETMYGAEGVGLAAPQVGVLLRVIVLDTSPGDEGAQPLAMINPVITAHTGSVSWNEGCLSIPGEYEDVERSERVTVRYQDEQGNPRELEASGLLAVAIQHEVDHLEGTVFVDHVSSLKRDVIRKRMKKLKAGEGTPAESARPAASKKRPRRESRA